MKKAYWIACPKCGKRHFIKLNEDTVLINYPAYCKGCKTEVIISVDGGKRLCVESMNMAAGIHENTKRGG